MANFWRMFRYFVLLAGFLMLGAYLFTSTPWREWVFGKPGYEAVIAEGEPVVEAVYRFKAERGLWPQYLEDVVPGYLAKLPEGRWHYMVTADGPSLAKVGVTGKTRTHVGYDFDKGSPAWRVFGDMENRVLRSGRSGVAATASGPSTQARLGATMEEFDRRIRRERTLVQHWREKASFLYLAGEKEQAKRVVQEAMKAHPLAVWPRLAEEAMSGEGVATTSGPAGVEMEVTTQNATQASTGASTGEAGFAGWVAAHPSYTNWFYVSVLRRAAGDESGALAAMEKMAALPMEVGEDDDRHVAYYGWDAARYALSKKRWEVVIGLCDEWEKAAEAGRTKEYSFLALRAAALLGRNKAGDWERAVKDMEALKRENTVTWASNQAKLRAAVEAKDTAFVYEPGSEPGAYVIFVQPE